ncbi:MAG: phosphatase PAP2 family protein [Melioribacteraceae bacterium]|nr:phosphatase PAP2 family protein [Melioribacteraceae bacterium]MCF8355697.1 phosphatase PAP2 family protein [Melioribacteraceae bacterium]MCF8394427.1 phosphatase PAP2 family protein [Melioribacteraceae bacterium]MCF8418561.1 phosphatase PAP2 family protein [Melioribacteraceae bacterium]
MYKDINHKISIACILILCTQILIAQPGRSTGEKLAEDGKIFLEDGISYFTYPLQMDAGEWLYPGVIFSGTYLLMHTDQGIKNSIGRNTVKTLNNDFWDYPTRLGIVQYANIGSLSLYTAGLLSGDDELRRVGRLLFESLSYSGLSVMALRIAAGRERPYSEKGPWMFTGFTMDNEIQSFPSGHTTVAFAVTTVLAEYYDTFWSRLGFYSLSALTAYARVLNNQHWFSDVVFGALIGISSGVHVITRERRRLKITADEPALLISPFPNGITLNIKLN